MRVNDDGGCDDDNDVDDVMWSSWNQVKKKKQAINIGNEKKKMERNKCNLLEIISNASL